MKLRMISAKTFEEYRKDNNVFIIDIREREKYITEHVPNAIWADWETLEDKISMLLPETDQMPKWIILYCDRGNTSLLVARDLARIGYPVISVTGGFMAWKQLKSANGT